MVDEQETMRAVGDDRYDEEELYRLIDELRSIEDSIYRAESSFKKAGGES